MTKKEAKKYLYWFNNGYKDQRAVAAPFKSTSLVFSANEQGYWDKANEAKKVLGIHQWQRTFEQLKITYPTLTHEQYLSFKIKHSLLSVTKIND